MEARKTILVADDSSTVRMLQELLLRRGPYDVITASDGAEAVRLALAQKPHLILMDIEMPKMNGIQACRTIRASAQGRDIPIIIVTTNSAASMQDPALKGNCSDVVHKPIDAALLLSKVKALVGA
jgi:CheY-like chemotaxis protein